MAGETVSVVVGKEGIAFAPYQTSTPVSTNPGYFIYAQPAGDDRLGGYPGGASKLVSVSGETLLQCDGASGGYAGGVDGFEGGLVAGNLKGATFAAGFPIFPSPNRVATGLYVDGGGLLGACGPNQYGVGNQGNKSYSIASGNYAGGSTPFGYGSGGGIYISGCFVSQIVQGTCIHPGPGRDGVVVIDVLY